MKHWKIYGLAVAAAALASAAQAADKPSPEVGKPARDYAVTTLDHHTVKAADLKGKVVVLNYWATWCGPCKLEMMAFENYMRTHPGTDLKIYAVMTESEVPAFKLQPLAKALSFPLATHLSGRGYGVKDGVPTSYVIDRSGVVRWAKAGAFDKESFDELVTPLLAEAAPAEPATTTVASTR
ncbi:TlpA disulfide reductase family protein [Phenylobacterium sp.]|uniref:TlpA family protein disulfide reductase n=1 Tax=Phenylobacterium sp. TaxID=1871053 RepID=UPI002DE6A054|nr:TlpA disulfide reductase family protein [Phenylobacterium sp.]